MGDLEQYISNKETHKNKIVHNLGALKLNEIEGVKHTIRGTLSTTYKEVIASLDGEKVAKIIEKTFCPNGTRKTREQVYSHPSCGLLVQIAANIIGEQTTIDGIYGQQTMSTVQKISGRYNTRKPRVMPHIPEDAYAGPKFFTAVLHMIKNPQLYQQDSRQSTQGIDKKESPPMGKLESDLFTGVMGTTTLKIAALNEYLSQKYVCGGDKIIPDDIQNLLRSKRQLVLNIGKKDIENNDLRADYRDLIETVRVIITKSNASLPIHIVGLAPLGGDTTNIKRKNARIAKTNKELALIGQQPGIHFHSREHIDRSSPSAYLQPKGTSYPGIDQMRTFSHQPGIDDVYTMGKQSTQTYANKEPTETPESAVILEPTYQKTIDLLFESLIAKNVKRTLIKPAFCCFVRDYKNKVNITCVNLERFARLLYRENQSLKQKKGYSLVGQVNRDAWIEGRQKMGAKSGSVPPWSSSLDTAYDQLVASYGYGVRCQLFEAKTCDDIGKALMRYNLGSVSKNAIKNFHYQAPFMLERARVHAKLEPPDGWKDKDEVQNYVLMDKITPRHVALAANDYYTRDIA